MQALLPIERFWCIRRFVFATGKPDDLFQHVREVLLNLAVQSKEVIRLPLLSGQLKNYFI